MFSVSAAAANVQMFGKRSLKHIRTEMGSKCQFSNFVLGQAKMSIYVSRQKTSDSSQTGAFKIFDVLL